MPLRFQTQPANGTAAVKAILRQLSGQITPLGSGLVDFFALAVNTPHGVYLMRADVIANGGGMETAQSFGFRYLIKASGRAVAAAEVIVNETGVAHVTTVNVGRFVEATDRAFAQLKAAEQLRMGLYEANLLRMQGMYHTSIWLKSDAGDKDLIYPLDNIPDKLEMEKLHTVDVFLDAIRPIAQQQIEYARKMSKNKPTRPYPPFAP